MMSMKKKKLIELEGDNGVTMMLKHIGIGFKIQRENLHIDYYMKIKDTNIKFFQAMIKNGKIKYNSCSQIIF